jgi:hypothetical protein
MVQPKKVQPSKAQPESTEQQLGKAPSTRTETQLVGRRVRITSFDWQRHMTGELVRVEKYLYLLRLDGGGIIAIHKHSCGAISALKEKTGGEQPES